MPTAHHAAGESFTKCSILVVFLMATTSGGCGMVKSEHPYPPEVALGSLACHPNEPKNFVLGAGDNLGKSVFRHYGRSVSISPVQRVSMVSTPSALNVKK